jgi:hypothetical protein
MQKAPVVPGLSVAAMMKFARGIRPPYAAAVRRSHRCRRRAFFAAKPLRDHGAVVSEPFEAVDDVVGKPLRCIEFGAAARKQRRQAVVHGSGRLSRVIVLSGGIMRLSTVSPVDRPLQL